MGYCLAFFAKFLVRVLLFCLVAVLVALVHRLNVSKRFAFLLKLCGVNFVSFFCVFVVDSIVLPVNFCKWVWVPLAFYSAALARNVGLGPTARGLREIFSHNFLCLLDHVSGYLRLIITPTMIEDTLGCNGKPTVPISVTNQRSRPLLTRSTSRDISACSLQGLFEDSSSPSLAAHPDSVASISRSLAEPRMSAVPTVPKKNPAILKLDSAISNLERLRTSLIDADKELVTTSHLLLQLSHQEEILPTSPGITPRPLLNIIEDSPPSNPLFTQSPVYESKEDYFEHHGFSGTTDPLAPERLMLSLKRSETKRFT